MNTPSPRHIERVLDPESSDYQKYIDVALTNGMTVRHGIDENERYVKEVLGPNRRQIERWELSHTDNMSRHLSDTVQVWLGELERAPQSESVESSDVRLLDTL